MKKTFRRIFIVPVLFSVLFLAGPCSAGAGMEKFAIVSDTHVGSPFHSAYPDIIRTLEDQGVETIVHIGDAINNPGNAYNGKGSWRSPGRARPFTWRPATTISAAKTRSGRSRSFSTGLTRL